MEIRIARPEEFETLGQITVTAYRHLHADMSLGAYENELGAVSARAADSQVLVAVDDSGEVLGGVTYVPDASRTMSEFSDPEAAGVRMLAVRPDRQGIGIGRALTQACITLARDDGRRRVILHSTEVMAVARRLYGRLGFVEGPELDIWIRRDGDEPLRLIAFVLALS
jgi:predicted N-acetyltransferase YhbS